MDQFTAGDASQVVSSVPDSRTTTAEAYALALAFTPPRHLLPFLLMHPPNDERLQLVWFAYPPFRSYALRKLGVHHPDNRM